MTLLSVARFLIAHSFTFFTVCALPAQAVTLDFESGVYAFPATGHTYTESGFQFATPAGNHIDSNDSPANTVFPGGLPHLVFHEAANNPVNNLITLTFSGGLFDLLSFELVFSQPVKDRNPAINPIMTVLGSDGQSLLTPSNGFLGTVFTPGFDAVSSVTFDINFNSVFAGNVILDNVVARAAGPTPSPIPLPGSWIMLVAGLGLLTRLGYKSTAENSIN
ncbi:MAG: hypothetical protein AAFQ55_09305 [Pseudomonadota bacterium]